MEKVDFFSDDLFREQPRNDTLFGINDAVEEGLRGGMAYTTTKNPSSWNATVDNGGRKDVVFQPLDHNMEVKSANGDAYSLCDGMLFTEQYGELAFVELKNKDKDWLQKSIEQLRSTITLFNANHNLVQFGRREAYAANSRHPQFMYSHRTEMQEFRNATRFRLYIQAKIHIS